MSPFFFFFVSVSALKVAVIISRTVLFIHLKKIGRINLFFFYFVTFCENFYNYFYYLLRPLYILVTFYQIRFFIVNITIILERERKRVCVCVSRQPNKRIEISNPKIPLQSSQPVHRSLWVRDPKTCYIFLPDSIIRMNSPLIWNKI